MFERRFDLDGVAVHLAGESESLAGVVDLLFREFPPLLEPLVDPAITIHIGSGSSPPDHTARPRFSFLPLRGYPQSDGWLLVDDHGFLEVRPALGSIRGALHPGADVSACGGFASLTLWVAVLECLRARGRYLVHAAGLIDRQGQLSLLIGESGAGKTSAALTALEAGWRVLTDDLLFLERADDGTLSTVAVRRRFHVGDEVLARRPHLRQFLRARPAFEPRDKQELDIESAFPGATVRRWGAPARLYFPALVDKDRSWRVPISPREAMLRTFPQSCFVAVQPTLAGGHLAALGALVDGAPAFRLFCGRDVFLNPEYLRWLEEAPCLSAASA